MHRVIIYTRKYCSFCYRAKDLLENKGITYQETEIDNSESLRQEMIQLSGRFTVPQIFIDDKAIGGCDELYALDKSGKLDEILKINPEIL